jgi:hypothetical protein
MVKFANKFLSTALAIVMIFTTIPFMTGCSSSQALADVTKFEPVVINALSLACVIVPTNPLCGTMKTKIQGDYTTVVKLWGDWNTAVANGTATSAMWNDLNAAFTVFESDSADIFSLGLSLNQPEVTAIVASAQLFLATIEALFPPSPSASMKSARFAAYATPGLHGSAWLSTWVKDYNQKVSVAQKLHPNAKLHQVHIHSLPVRIVTLGRVS